MSAFFQTFRPCLIVGPGNHTRKHKKYNEHDCAHHHGVEWHWKHPISKTSRYKLGAGDRGAVRDASAHACIARRDHSYFGWTKFGWTRSAKALEAGKFLLRWPHQLLL